MLGSPLAALRAGAVILHVGEIEDFLNCRAPGGYRVRAADLPGVEGRLPEGTVALISSPAWRQLQEDAPDLVLSGRALAPEVLRGASSGAICFAPALSGLWGVVLPRASLRPSTPISRTSR